MFIPNTYLPLTGAVVEVFTIKHAAAILAAGLQPHEAKQMADHWLACGRLREVEFHECKGTAFARRGKKMVGIVPRQLTLEDRAMARETTEIKALLEKGAELKPLIKMAWDDLRTMLVRILIDEPESWPKTQRKMLGVMRLAAAKMTPVTNTLAVAEGVERRSPRTCSATARPGHSGLPARLRAPPPWLRLRFCNCGRLLDRSHSTAGTLPTGRFLTIGGEFPSFRWTVLENLCGNGSSARLQVRELRRHMWLYRRLALRPALSEWLAASERLLPGWSR